MIKLYPRILWWIESLKEQHLFEIEIFCNIVNVFKVNLMCPSWINLLISFKKENLLTPNFLQVMSITINHTISTKLFLAAWS